jgi:transposase
MLLELDKHRLNVIACDGIQLGALQEMKELLIAPGQRADVLVHAGGPDPAESRERETLLRERIQHTNRIRALLCGPGDQGLQPATSRPSQNCRAIQTGDGRPLPAHLKAEIIREIERLEVVLRQLDGLEAERDARARVTGSPTAMLMRLKSVGPEFATVLYHEGLFRNFDNRRQLAAYAGLRARPSTTHRSG